MVGMVGDGGPMGEMCMGKGVEGQGRGAWKWVEDDGCYIPLEHVA